MAKRWQQSEISYLQRYGKGKPVEELARRFKTDARTVKAKLAELAPARPGRAKSPAKPAAKPAAKAVVRPLAKPLAKVPAKPVAKPAARIAAKPAARASIKRPAKPPAKPPSKPPSKPVTKAPAKPATTTSTKPAAKAPAKAPAKPAAMTASKPTTPPAIQKAGPKAGPKTGSKTGPKTGQKAAAAAAPPQRPAELPDPALTAYTEALKALHKQDWARAVKLFEKLAVDEDRPEIAARARQYLAAARQRQEGEAEPGDREDAYLTAVFEKNRGNLAAALEICRRGGRDKKDERFAYLAASIHALESRSEEAAQALAQAVELNPKNRIHAYHDADFAELRKDRDFRHLFDLP
jgi:hypothetical protein